MFNDSEQRRKQTICNVHISISSKRCIAKRSKSRDNVTAPVSMKLGAKIVPYSDSCFSLKMRFFSCVLVILTVVQTEWHASDSQNVILNNFEEYYSYTRCTC